MLLALSLSACSISTTSGAENISVKLHTLLNIQSENSTACAISDYAKDPVFNGSAEGIKQIYCGNYEAAHNALSAAVDGFSKAKMGDYRGLFYELPVLLSYQGLNQLNSDQVFDNENGNWDKYENALMYFSKASLEQEKIFQKYKKEISDLASSIGGSDGFVFRLMQNLANSAIRENIQELIGINCSGGSRDYAGDVCKILQAEQGFVNSYVEYMKALDLILLKEYGSADMLLAKNAKKHNEKIFKKISQNAQKAQKPGIYVVYENGESRGLEDKIISFVIPTNLDKIIENAPKLLLAYGALSLDTKIDRALIEAIGGLTEARGVLPKLTDSKSSYEFIRVDNKAGDKQESKVIADMDVIITKDYNANLSLTMLKAMIDAALKTALNVAAAELHPLLGFVTNKVTQAINHSDVRRVVGLPKNYQLTMVANSGKIAISDSFGNEIFVKDNLNKSKNYLVYVKSPAVGVNYIKIMEGK